MDQIAIINLYPQAAWHEPARIELNRTGLRILRELLNAAEEYADGHADIGADVFASDGEQYPLEVAVTETPGEPFYVVSN